MGLSLGKRFHSPGVAIFWGPNYYEEGVRNQGAWIPGGSFRSWPRWIRNFISRVGNDLLCAVYDHEYDHILPFVVDGQIVCTYCGRSSRQDKTIA